MGRPRKLGVTTVSRELHALIKTMESQAMSVEAATFNAQRDDRYAALSATRATLYAYVGDLERRAGIPQTAKLRF